MSIELNHTIVHARNKRESANFLSEIMGLPHFGGRGVYFEDPSGHYLEIITKPYVAW